MNNFLPFGKEPKCPHEMVKKLNKLLEESLQKGIQNQNSSIIKIIKFNKYLNQIREHFYGTFQCIPQSKEFRSALIQEMYKTNILKTFIQKLSFIPFDGKKNIVYIFGHIIGERFLTRLPTVEYICENRNILYLLMKGYENKEIALFSGQILRDCIQFETLSQIVFNLTDETNEKLYLRLFDYIKNSSFAICSDAFSTFEDLMTRPKQFLREGLERDYGLFFTKFNELLNSENYYIKRKAIKLLVEILLNRNNMTSMKKYIQSADNFDLIKRLLQHECYHITYAAFQVLDLFVRNPEKSQPIKDHLIQSKQFLIDLIMNYQKNRCEVDSQLSDGNSAILIKTLSELN